MKEILRRDLPLLAVLALFCYLPGIGSRDLWNPDEPRYGQVAREMLEGGKIESFVVPHLNGGLYTHKPPLLFWSIAAFSAPFGDVSEITTRIPSLLAAVAAILGVYLLGLLLFGRRTAWMAALILGTCYKINWQGHVGQIDMLLAALVLWSVYFWARAYLEKKPGFYWLYFVFAGLATLAKGPVGLLPTLIAILVFLALYDRPALREFPLWRGLASWAGVVLLWLGPALYWGGELYQKEILFKQNVTRYVDPWHHLQPPYYFLQVLPTDFLPWSLLLPAALVAGWRLLRGEERRRWIFLIVWVLTTLVFFSVSPAKRTVYILPLYPAVAILTACGLDLLARRMAEIKPRMSPWWLRAPALFLTAVVALAALAAFVVGPGRKEVAMVGPDLPYLLGGGLLVLAAGLAWATRELWRYRIEGFVVWKAASFAFFLAFAWAVLVPRLDPVKSTRALCEKLVTLAGPDEPYATFPNFDATFLFYCRRFAAADLDESEKKLNDFVNRPERVFLAVERDDWKLIENKPDLIEVHRDPDERGGYLLFTNRRPAPAGAPP
jgi:4-amino-4-deoxy-L-arabinose transferase-like glycosyltransferase